MRITIVSNNYPTYKNPNKGAFVFNVVQMLAKTNQVTVISPLKIQEYFSFKPRVSYGIENCKVYRPLYLSVSNKRIFGINFARISLFFQSIAVSLCLLTRGRKTDAIYCHFIVNALTIYFVAKMRKTPVVIASGESSYENTERYGVNLIKQLLVITKHIICVSQNNYDYFDKYAFPVNKKTLLPNAVDYELFKPGSGTEVRDKLKIPHGKFVVGFIGHFIDRKGPNRIIDALDKLQDPDIYLICVGAGSLPERDYLRVVNPVPNSSLPKYFNAFDVFVLPTLAEGHCNVIEEAKACSIPIISSLGTSVEEQVSENFGILVNPLDTVEIGKAISVLKTSPQILKSMKKVLFDLRGQNSLKERAKKIERIIEGVVHV